VSDAEHPAVTVADKIGQKVAEHVNAARAETNAAETLRRLEALTGTLASLYETTNPAVVDSLAPVMATIDADSPLYKLLDSLQSPEGVLQSAILDILGFIGQLIGITGVLAKVTTQADMNKLWTNYPNVPLSPQDCANALQQGAPGELEGGFDYYAEALNSGVDADHFAILAYLAGDAPAPQQLYEMFRRQIINQDQVVSGLLQGRTKDSWVNSVAALVYAWPSPELFVNAAVREQIPYATAADWYANAGNDNTTEVAPGITFFDLAFDVNGRPPGPGELAHMYFRGIIPESGTGPSATTFQQGIAESDLKTKWTNELLALYQYVPAIGEIKQMYLHGAIDQAQAVTYLGMQGVDANLAQSILFLAEQEYVAQDKRLAKGEIEDLYVQGSLDAAQATEQLNALGYRGATADWILAVATIRREQKILDRSIQRIGQQFATGAIDLVGAGAALARLGVPNDQIVWLQDEWVNVQQLQSKRLSESQVAAAYYYTVMDEATAIAYLQSLGYSAYDSWVLLSIRVHEAQPNKPAPPSLPAPIPNPTIVPPTPPPVITEAPPALPTLPGQFPAVP
jgi:hypothetical protein